jgi:hypothetical protein
MTHDIYYLGQAAVKIFSVGAYNLFFEAYTWLRSPLHGLDRQIAALDLRWISWTLQTSVEHGSHYERRKKKDKSTWCRFVVFVMTVIVILRIGPIISHVFRLALCNSLPLGRG